MDGANTVFFMIMNQFGSFLEGYFNKLKNNYMNLVSIYSLGSTLIDQLEIIHNAGYIHNDLSLEKMFLGYKQKIVDDACDLTTNCFKSVPINMQAWTYYTEYTNRKTGQHLK